MTDDVLEFEFKEDKYVLRIGEIDGHMDEVSRSATGHPMMWWFAKGDDVMDLGAEGVGVLLWAARYQAGEHDLDVRTVTRAMTYGDLATFAPIESDGDEVEGENPEV